MSDETKTEDPQDPLIRKLLLGGAVSLVAGALVFALIIAIMVSYNFNFLNWME